jgi:hypothetical protein
VKPSEVDRHRSQTKRRDSVLSMKAMLMAWLLRRELKKMKRGA